MSDRKIAVDPDLIALTGDGNAALFLTQVIFWSRTSDNQPFYKFNAPCDHPLYRPGDSWEEELRMGRAKLCTARRRVAQKVRGKDELAIEEAMSSGVLVVYWTDEHHVTRYLLNEAALLAHCPTLSLERFGGRRSSPQSAPPAPDVSLCPVPAVAGDGSEHSLMSDADNSILTEKTTESLSETIPPTPTAPPTTDSGLGGGEKKTGVKREHEFLIQTTLQNEGVQLPAARLIASHAVRAGFGVAEALDYFEAHKLDAKEARAASPLAVAVHRMTSGATLGPPPPEILARVRRLRQFREMDEILADLEFEPDDTPNSPVQDVSVDLETEEIDPLVLLGITAEDEQLWQVILGQLSLQFHRADFEKWVRHTWLRRDGEQCVLYAADGDATMWLQNRAQRTIKGSLERYLSVPVTLMIISAEVAVVLAD